MKQVPFIIYRVTSKPSSLFLCRAKKKNRT
nr:MAG TPA: hypothetical protein [Caudoviricetes sp.]